MPAAKPPFPVLNRGHPLAPGLILALPFHEGSGPSVNDVSGRGRNGTINSGTVWGGGQSGWALLFNTSTGSVSLPSTLSVGPPFTAAMSVYRTASTGVNGQAFVNLEAGANSWCIGLGLDGSSSNAHGFEKGGVVDITSAVTCVANVWERVVWVVGTDNKPLLYVNGALKFSSTNGTAFTSTARSNLLGSGGAGFAGRFGGLLDAVYLWDHALTLAEVETDYADSFALFRRSARRFTASVTPYQPYLPIPQRFDPLPSNDISAWQRRPLLTVSGSGPVVNSPVGQVTSQRIDREPEYWHWWQQVNPQSLQVIDNPPDAPGDLLQQRVFLVNTDG